MSNKCSNPETIVKHFMTSCVLVHHNVAKRGIAGANTSRLLSTCMKVFYLFLAIYEHPSKINKNKFDDLKKYLGYFF